MKFLILSFLLVNAYFCTSSEIVRARLESCPGCSLTQLTEVRQFVYEDIPKYDRVEWKKISGASPELIFLNDKDEEVERVHIRKFNREECNEVLQSRGFSQRSNEL